MAQSIDDTDIVIAASRRESLELFELLAILEYTIGTLTEGCEPLAPIELW